MTSEAFIEIKNKAYKIPAKYGREKDPRVHDLYAKIINRFDRLCQESAGDPEEIAHRIYFMDCVKQFDDRGEQEYSFLKDQIIDDPGFKPAIADVEQVINEKGLSDKEAQRIYDLASFAFLVGQVYNQNTDTFKFNNSAYFINEIFKKDDPELETLFLLALGKDDPECFLKKMATKIDFCWPQRENFIDLMKDQVMENLERYGFEGSLAKGIESRELYMHSAEYDPDLIKSFKKIKLTGCKRNSFEQSFLRLTIASKKDFIIGGRVTDSYICKSRFSECFLKALNSTANLMDHSILKKTCALVQEHVKTQDLFSVEERKKSLQEIIGYEFSFCLENAVRFNSKNIFLHKFAYYISKLDPMEQDHEKIVKKGEEIYLKHKADDRSDPFLMERDNVFIKAYKDPLSLNCNDHRCEKIKI